LLVNFALLVTPRVQGMVATVPVDGTFRVNNTL